MIRAEFFSKADHLNGFSVSGHSGYADAGEDIVCAAVSSAVQLTANGITEVLGAHASVSAEGDTVSLNLESASEGNAEVFLEALRLHLSLLAEDYPKNVKLIYTEV
ncbi:MAG: ribosomal-processing cysteine protease Prp [Oscillospiraceae bacterium]|nr:ribosomal-processing cysteine protease Prp [Oscillospiraceae bacterium]